MVNYNVLDNWETGIFFMLIVVTALFIYNGLSIMSKGIYTVGFVRDRKALGRNEAAINAISRYAYVQKLRDSAETYNKYTDASNSPGKAWAA
jgi:hypothetical protein